MLGHLVDGQLLRTYERGPRNLVAITDPLDHGAGEGFAQGADTPFSIEAVGDFFIRQAFGEISDSIDNLGRVPHAVSYIGPELHANVTASAALPADVNQKLFQIGRFLDRNILDEQPQHSFAVFGLCGGRMPQARQIGSESEDFGPLLVSGYPGFLTLKFRGLFFPCCKRRSSPSGSRQAGFRES